MSERLDIILFGATGFTGKYCIRALYHLTKLNAERPLTWGVAGRSEAKLKDALAYCQDKLGGDADLNDIPIIIADVNNYDLLKHMTSSARVVINCCGPYRFYGEPVIKACIETGTHQIDVTGEPQFMELIQLKYHELAKENGVYIINSCGFDSIATDMGVIFMEQNFEGTLNSVESFITRSINMKNPPNGTFNVGTWESAVYGFANAHELKEIRSKLNEIKLPKFLPKLQTRKPYKRNELLDGNFSVPVPSCDRSVVYRTRRHLFESKNKRPIQFETYYTVQTRRGLLLLAFCAKIFQFLAQHEYGRKLLVKFPDFFSNGYVTSGDNLSEEKLDNITINMRMLGKGWDRNAATLENDPHNFQELPNKTIFGSVEGRNPSYGVASAAAVLSAIIVLSEGDKLPARGGVYTPGAAFIDTSLIEQLQKNNVLRFKIKSKL